MKQQQGLSLIELMISLTLGIILMTGVMQMFLTSRETYSTQQALSRVQETGRMAMNYLSQDLRMAGYMGCVSRSATPDIHLDLSSGDDYLYRFDEPIRGYEYNAADAPTGFDTAANTELLTIRRATGGSVSLVQQHQAGTNAEFRIDAAPVNDCLFGGQLCDDQVAIISDCSQSLAFRAVNIRDLGAGAVGEGGITHAVGGSSPNNLDPTLGGRAFDAGAQILGLNTITYYIAKSDFSSTGDVEVRSLYRQVGEGGATELVEGVTDMRIEYGLDTTNDAIPDTYKSPSVLSDAEWLEVQAVRVHLLVVSPEPNVVPDPLELKFAGTDTTIDDRRLGHVFTSTIALRNRLD